MKQNDLNRAVALSTGESVAEIARRGFVPLDEVTEDDGPPVDWDELEASRTVVTDPRRRTPRVI